MIASWKTDSHESRRDRNPDRKANNTYATLSAASCRHRVESAQRREQLQRFFLLFFNDSKSMSSTKNTIPLAQIQKIGSHLPILRPSENKQAG
jgi:hypothetical protein